ncbi:MAG: TonB-dependent receptor [Xanthomonadales bacterium]|nr:TonB-dependent receptor [Xanthomonadales bacterium]
MNKFSPLSKLSCLTLASFLVAPLSGAAQTADDDALMLEEVVVTAQRRQESLQDVPISISVFGNEQLVKTNITNAAQYLVMTPNVGYSEDGEGGSRSINISIRGVSNVTLDGVASANSIGYYIDELSVGAMAQGTINPQLQDVEQIEVLRGPQGTYYGRNAVGGALNITTVKPNEEFYFEGSLTGANFGTYGAEAIINVPFSDRFFARGVFAYEESDTPIKNVNELGNDPFYEYTTGRISFRALPTDNVTMDLSVTMTNEDEGGDIAIPSGIVDLDTQSIFGFGPYGGIDTGLGFYPTNDDRIDRDTIEANKKDFTIVNGRINWDLGNVQLTSVTGYIDSTFFRQSDLDGIPLTFGPLPLRRENDYDATTWSQEFRLMSSGDSKADWTIGAIYIDDDSNRSNQIQRMPDNMPSGEEVGYINNDVQNYGFKSTAIFGEATLPVVGNFDLTVGARFSQDKVSTSAFDIRQTQPLSGSETFTDFSPRIVLRHMTDSTTWYGSVSKGYKAGGVDVSGASRTQPAPFESEDLWNYEVGFKSQFAGGRTTLSGAVFFLDWSDFQVQTIRLDDPNDIGSSISTTQNADSASSKGAELEFSTLLTPGLVWTANLGYVDAQFDDYKNAVLRGRTNGIPNMIDVSGKPLPRTPEWTFNTSLQYDWDIGSNSAYVRGEYAYTDNQYSDIEAIGSLVGETVNGDPFILPTFPYQIPDYTVVNLFAGMEGDRYRVVAFMKNALDEQYYTGTADNFGAAGIRLKPHFREFGIKVTFKTR